MVQAQEKEEQMRRFVGDASHELRTPLTSLRGYTDKLIGFAPMGCQTGFYAITYNMEQD